MDDVVRKVLDETASGWLGSIDRSVIGSLASPFDALVVIAAMDTMGSYPVDEHTVSRSKELSKMLDRVFSDEDVYNAMAQVSLAELEYAHWWAIHHGRQHPTFSKLSLNQFTVMWVWMMGAATERPERLPYLEAGISDVVFIDRCIDDGVDAELALLIAR